jgi:hypothetical protein
MGCKVARPANIDFDIRLEIFSLRPPLILTLVAQAGRTFSSCRSKVVRANGNVDGHMVNATRISGEFTIRYVGTKQERKGFRFALVPLEKDIRGFI